MTIYTPAYRLTLYASRSVDATETTVLTPRAGSAHAEQFVVTTGVGGGRAYIVGAPQGRKSKLDPIRKTLDTGSLSLVIQDTRVTPGGSQAIRWLTAFMGDDTGASALLGLRARVEESLNGGTSWADFFVGRVSDVALNSGNPGEIVLGMRSLVEDANRRAFVSTTPTTGADPITYAFTRPPWPNVAVPIFATGSTPFTDVVVSRKSSTLWLVQFLPTPRLGEIPALGGDPAIITNEYAVAFFNKDTGVEVARYNVRPRFIFAGYIGGRRNFEEDMKRADNLVEFEIVNGSPITFTRYAALVRRVAGSVPPTDDTPLWLRNVHPVRLARHILQGRFGYPRSDGSALAAVPIDTGTFTALEADTSLVSMRFRIAEPVSSAVEWLEEKVLAPNNLALCEATGGVLSIIDLRRKQSIPTASSITEADAILGRDAEWNSSQDDAVASVRTSITQDVLVASDVTYRGVSVYGNDAPEDYRAVDYPLVLLDTSPRVQDVNGKQVTMDGEGWRYSGTEPSETNLVLLRSGVLRNYARERMAEVVELFGSGSVIFSRHFARDLTRDALWRVGSWHLVDSSVFPNLASNQRGGQRLALILAREENGPEVRLTFLDGGPNTVAVVPTVGAPALDGTTPRHVISFTLTPNVAGTPVEWAYAAVASGGAIPTAGSAWIYGGLVEWPVGVTTAQTITLRNLPNGKTIWIRARSIQTRGNGRQLPSPWVSPASVTTAAVPTPTGVAVAPIATDPTALSVTWTNTSTTQPVVVDVQPTGGVVRRAFILPAGAGSTTLRGLIPNTSYSVSVGYQGDVNDDGTLVTVSGTTANVAVRPMAGVTAGGVEDVRSSVLGVPVYLFPADAELATEVQSAADVAGAPDWANALSISVPPGQVSLVDQRSDTAARRWYRARHVAGAGVSEWTSEVNAFPRRLPVPLPPPVVPPVPGRPDIQYTLTPEGVVTVQLTGDATTVGHRVVLSLTGPADATTLRASPLRTGRLAVVPALASLTSADAPFWLSAIAINASGGESDVLTIAAQRVGYALPTPTVGTAIPGVVSIGFPVIFDNLTSYVEVFATEDTADPGTPTSQEFGVPLTTLSRGGTQSRVDIPITRGDSWLVVTFVPYDALGRRGVVINRKAQGAGTSVTAPNSPTVVTVGTVTGTSVVLNLTMPTTNLPDVLVLERDGVPFGGTFARSVGAGAVQAITVTGLSPSTAYSFRVRGQSTGGVSAAAASPVVSVTTASAGALAAFSTLSATATRIDDLNGTFPTLVQIAWSTGDPAHPTGTTYRVEKRYTVVGGWLEEGTTTGNNFSWMEELGRTLGADLMVRVIASYPGYTDTTLVVA
jgi:hypothetical protein